LEALKAEGIIPRRVALRQCKYLSNVIEQDHRTVKNESGRRRDMDRFRVHRGRCRASRQ
jgi:transposase-like protein